VSAPKPRPRPTTGPVQPHSDSGDSHVEQHEQQQQIAGVLTRGMLRREEGQSNGEDFLRTRVGELKAQYNSWQQRFQAAETATSATEAKQQEARKDNERLTTTVAEYRARQGELTAEAAKAHDWRQRCQVAQQQLKTSLHEAAISQNTLKRVQAKNESLRRALERKSMGAEDIRSTCVRQQHGVAMCSGAAQEKRQGAAENKKVAGGADERSRQAAQREVLASHESMERQPLTTGQSAINDGLIDELIDQLEEIRTQELQVRREWEHTLARGWPGRLQEIKAEFQAQTKIKTKLEKQAQKELDPLGDMLESLAGELGKLQRALPMIKDEVELQVSTASSGTPDSNKAGSHVSAVDEQDLVALSYW